MLTRNIIATIWPPARRRAREAEALRLKKAAQEAKKQRELAENERLRIKREQPIQDAYNAHVKAVDLNGIFSRRNSPLSVSDIPKEVGNRFRLAVAANQDLNIKLADKMTDQQIDEIIGGRDETALYWLLEHAEPDRQKDAAKKLLDDRAKVTPRPDLEIYVTAVAEAATRLRGPMSRRKMIEGVVTARAILMRSASTRWDRPGKRGPRPLSSAL